MQSHTCVDTVDVQKWDFVDSKYVELSRVVYCEMYCMC